LFPQAKRPELRRKPLKMCEDLDFRERRGQRSPVKSRVC
jgi:hypothetical protein